MMNSRTRAMSLLAAVALAFSLSFGSPAWAGEAQANATPSVEQKVEDRADAQTAEKRKQVLQEATGAIRETQNALRALDEEKSQEALAALERAAGKLEIILAREPDLALAPADVNTITYDVLATVDQIEHLREEAENALENGRVQEARRLIRDLASETVIRVTQIPLASYPDAIRKAASLIDDGEMEAASGVLQTALNTLVVTETVIPLPVVTARQLLSDAREMAQKEARSEEESAQIAEYLEDARRELEFADQLGYGSERDFASLYEELDKLHARIDEGGSGKGFFARIRDLLNDTVDSSQPEKTS